MKKSNVCRFGALIFLLSSVSSAKADSEALSAIATLPCDELEYNNLSRNSQGDAPFGIQLRRWDQGAVSAIYDRIRACTGEIDPVQARFALQQGSRFLDGIVRRAASARAGAQQDVALMETIQRNLADIEISTLPPAQVLSKLDAVQAGVQAVSRALPPNIRDAFQRRIDVKRASLTAALQAQAEREQKAAEDRLARLSTAANTPATTSPLASSSTGVIPSPIESVPQSGVPQSDPKIAEARKKTRLAEVETAHLESDLRRKQVEANASKLDKDELIFFQKSLSSKNIDFNGDGGIFDLLSVMYRAEIEFRACKERTSEFNEDLQNLMHQEGVVEGAAAKLGLDSKQEILNYRSQIGLGERSKDSANDTRSYNDVVLSCRNLKPLVAGFNQMFTP